MKRAPLSKIWVPIESLKKVIVSKTICQQLKQDRQKVLSIYLSVVQLLHVRVICLSSGVILHR
jgi:hypothetical protein